jgi:hypothetical protein
MWAAAARVGVAAPRVIRFGDSAMKDRKLVLACIVAPLVTPFTFIIFAFLEDPPPLSLEEILLGIMVNTLSTVPFAYAAEIILGLPMWLIFCRYRIRSIAAFALGGALIGWIVAFALAASGSKTMATVIENPGWFKSGLACVFAASASAVVFRSIVQAEGAH